MSEVPLLKADLPLIGEGGQTYDRLLHDRFVAWRERGGYSLKEVADKLCRSQAGISQYINLRYRGDLGGIEEDIRNFLRREQHYRPTTEGDIFCAISPSVTIWEVAEYCKRELKMGAAVGPAGTSKTKTALELKRKYPATVLITASLTLRSMGAILQALIWEFYSWNGSSHYHRFEDIVEKLSNRKTFMIFDEAHLLSWEALEIIRSLWDRAPCGILLLGMPKTLSQMRTNRGFLWDQIASRLAISRTIGDVTKGDVKLLADSILPGLSKPCLNFLHEKALGPGRLRTTVELLKRGVQVSSEEGISLSLQLLKELDESFM